MLRLNLALRALTLTIMGFSKKISNSSYATELAIADAPSEAVPFSFMVIGDTDAGDPRKAASASATSAKSFSEGFGEQILQQSEGSCFMLHTGDVTYPIGSYQHYFNGFLKPYRALLSHLPARADYDGRAVVFNQALLPVPGNHDYADLPRWARWRQGMLRAVCDRLRQSLNWDLGHYGGYGGEAYAKTFLDNLTDLPADRLAAHLAMHYSSVTNLVTSPAAQDNPLSAAPCLSYRPGQFTRLPNRYYHFRYGGVDFFALDSNTWKTSAETAGFDHDQLDWLVQQLVDSWHRPRTVGRIIYLHHSPYTTEESRWQQAETLWVRRHLRQVLARVAAAVQRPDPENSPWVDLIFSGHAHCLEHLYTADTGYADAHLNWVVCGGSGANIRRQRPVDSNDILENMKASGSSHAFGAHERRYPKVVARSQCFIGSHGQGRKKQRFHSFIRVDVRPQQRQKFTVIPFAVTQSKAGFLTHAIAPLKISNPHPETLLNTRQTVRNRDADSGIP